MPLILAILEALMKKPALVKALVERVPWDKIDWAALLEKLMPFILLLLQVFLEPSPKPIPPTPPTPVV